jgi:hypothetical protein
MNYKDLVERHPEVALDRHSLVFSRSDRPADIVAALSRSGVVQLQQALPPELLEKARGAFQRHVDTPGGGRTAAAGEGPYLGAWFTPWAVREGDFFPSAALMAAVIRSWIWDVVEQVCGSPHLVLLLKWCTARHSIDRLLGVGGHQDAKVVARDVPFSIWIPLNPVIPGQQSGLGFVVPPPGGLLPTLPHDDIGADYVLADPARLWVPPYALGDLTIHTGLSPHFTTGFGTETHRYSLEMRAMPRSAAPPDYLDPAVWVSRRNGLPTIVEQRPLPDGTADALLASPDFAKISLKSSPV